MALEDLFGYSAPEDRMIGGEWYTWVSKPGGGGNMVAYSELSPVEQAKLEIGRQYGQPVYTTAEKEGLSAEQAQQIWQSYPQEMRDAMNAAGSNRPEGGYLGGGNPGDYAPQPAPIAPPPQSPITPVPGPTPPVAGPSAPDAGYDPLSDALLKMDPSDLDNILATNPEAREKWNRELQTVNVPRGTMAQNELDNFDWVSAQADALRGQPQQGFGGGAQWNRYMPQQQPGAPMSTPGMRPYSARALPPGPPGDFVLPAADMGKAQNPYWKEVQEEVVKRLTDPTGAGGGGGSYNNPGDQMQP